MLLFFTGILEEWKKKYREKGVCYLAGSMLSDGYQQLLGAVAVGKISSSVGRTLKKASRKGKTIIRAPKIKQIRGGKNIGEWILSYVLYGKRTKGKRIYF